LNGLQTSLKAQSPNQPVTGPKRCPTTATPAPATCSDEFRNGQRMSPAWRLHASRAPTALPRVLTSSHIWQDRAAPERLSTPSRSLPLAACARVAHGHTSAMAAPMELRHPLPQASLCPNWPQHCHHLTEPYPRRTLAQARSRGRRASAAVEADRRGRKQPVLVVGSPWPISSRVNTFPGCAISRGSSCAPSPVAQPPERRRRRHCPHGAARARGQQATGHLGPCRKRVLMRLAAAKPVGPPTAAVRRASPKPAAPVISSIRPSRGRRRPASLVSLSLCE
jgi:hypothetical protein